MSAIGSRAAEVAVVSTSRAEEDIGATVLSMASDVTIVAVMKGLI